MVGYGADGGGAFGGFDGVGGVHWGGGGVVADCEGSLYEVWGLFT